MAPPSKAALRSSVTARLAALTPDQIERQSASLCRQALEHPALASVRVIMAYAPMPREADVRPLIAAWALMAASQPQRRVCLPRVDWAARRMDAVLLRDWQHDLQPGPRPGLLEPRADLPVVDPAQIEAVLVPGVAFDLRGGRLGRGAGFYDRFLAAFDPARPTLLIGVALAEQVVPEVPMEPHDVKMGWLATPDGLQRCTT